MTRLSTVAAALAAAALAACGTGGQQDLLGVDPGARIKFFNFGVGAPNVNFYANDAKMTAVSTTNCSPPNDTTTVCRTTGLENTVGTAAGGAAAGGLYSGIAPGQYTFTGRISATTDNGLAIASVPASIAAGKFYSYYISGIYDATGKKADAFVVEDALPATIDQTVALVRIVNAISNSNGITLAFRNPVTLQEAAPSGTVPYKSATGYTTLAVGAGNAFAADLVLRNAGTTTPAAIRTGVTFSAGRVYTITARGDITVTSTTSANRPQLDVTANY